jgi:uncharacterized protein (TIRG00374 family)
MPVIPKWLGAMAKIAVSVGLIAFLLLHLNRVELVDRFSRVQPLWLLLALGLYFVAIFLGVLKWLLVVRVQRLGVSFWSLAAYTFTGLFVGNVLPSNVGGDIIRAYLLARARRGTTEAAAISVLVDRLLGLVAFFGAALVTAALALTLLTHSAELESLQAATLLAAAIFIPGCALLFSRRVGHRLTAVFQLRLLACFKPRVLRLYRALQVYRFSYGTLAENVLLSESIIVAATLVWYSVARALGIHLSIFYFFLFNPLIAFVLLLPISFNGLGPKEATAVFFFGLVGVPSESALALSLLFHAIVVLTSLPGGVLWWRQQGGPMRTQIRADWASGLAGHAPTIGHADGEKGLGATKR